MSRHTDGAETLTRATSIRTSVVKCPICFQSGKQYHAVREVYKQTSGVITRDSEKNQ